MSSVNSSDGANRQDDVVRRNREDYKQKESELVKKHQREIRRLNEAHYSEVENLKESHSGQMGEVQNKSRETMSRRDMKFQKEVENLRELHRKQMADLANDSQTRLENTQKASGGEVELVKNQFAERSNDMSETHRREMKEKEGSYYQAINELREAQKEAIDGTREKMNRKHEGELKALTHGSTTDKAEMQRQYRNYRQSAESRLKQQEMQHMTNRQRESDNFLGTVRNERLSSEDSKERLREGFNESLKDIDDKYDRKRQEDLKYSALSHESMKSGVHERINNKVRSLENENRDLEAKNIRDNVSRDQRKAQEIKNARDAFQANVEVYKNQKEMLQETMNKEHAKDIQEVHGENSKIMQMSSRQYLDQMNTNNAKNKEAVVSQKNDFEARQNQTATQADSRVKRVIETVNEDQTRLTKHFQSNFDIMRAQQDEEVKGMQLNHISDKAEATERLKEQMRQREFQNQEKLNTLKTKYEKQIAELNDKRTLESRSATDNMKRQAEELKRAHQLELESQQIQFKEKLAKVQQAQQNELKTVNDRHAEKVDQLVGAMRKS